MGNDRYKHSSAGVSTVLSNLDSKISSYREIVSDVSKELNMIGQSGAWKDAQIKAAYLKNCENYMNSFNAMIGVMMAYRAYLEGADNKGTAIEDHYAGG